MNPPCHCELFERNKSGGSNTLILFTTNGGRGGMGGNAGKCGEMGGNLGGKWGKWGGHSVPRSTEAKTTFQAPLTPKSIVPQ